jgi:hypothetical protein
MPFVAVRSVVSIEGETTMSQHETRTTPLEISKDTLVSDILAHYGDIADVMEVFGVKRVGRFSIRRVLTRFLTVERAARVHRVPLDEFLVILRTAVARVAEARSAAPVG